MCLVIHKPAGITVDDALLDAAARFNPHGFGLMAFDGAGKIIVRRRSHTRLRDLVQLSRTHERLECVIHIRHRTHGSVDLPNTQPLKVTNGIYLVHNGWIPIDRHSEAHSDTWHLINDYLRPILRHRPDTLYERSFHDLIRSWTGEHNRFVFMDARTSKTTIINEEAGCRVGGLWLSNSRWLDSSRFTAVRTQPLPVLEKRQLRFLS